MTTAATGLPTVAAVVVAAGSGVRLGAGVPKAFCDVGGRTLLERAVGTVQRSPRIGAVVVVAPPDLVESAQSLLDASVVVVAGGNSRQASVSLGLAALPSAPTHVLVHDVARAFVPLDVVARVVAALDAGADAVVPVQPLVDTVTAVAPDGAVLGTVDRSTLRIVQTPQGFRFASLVAAHAAAAAGGFTDDASVIEAAGGRVVAVEGSELAFKVTRPLDLQLAALVAAAGEVDVGAAAGSS